MVEDHNKVRLKNDIININNLSIDDANTYKILNDIPETKREDFVKKAIVIGAIGLRNLYLTENVDYIEKEIQKIDDEIDQEVYKIYGITKEEQKIISISLIQENTRRLNSTKKTGKRIESISRKGWSNTLFFRIIFGWKKSKFFLGENAIKLIKYYIGGKNEW